jgi:hypothetical protein
MQNETEASPLLVQRMRSIADEKEPIQDNMVRGDETIAFRVQVPSITRTRMTSLWNIPSAKHHLMPYCVFSLAVSSLDEAFPLFCIASSNVGLGLSENSIGQILPAQDSCLSRPNILFALTLWMWRVQVSTKVFGLDV